MIIYNNKTKLTKTEVAKRLGCSRSSLYYTKKIPDKDIRIKTIIKQVMAQHPAYGHKRIAIELNINKKRALRVMKKFGLKPYRRRAKKPNKKDDCNKEPSIYQNLIKDICPIRPNIIWVADFTYIDFQGAFIYLATIEDRFTRKVIGYNIARRHTTTLVAGALRRAIDNTGATPVYHHCDQGSEYDAKEYISLLNANDIKISMSKKASPWENPHKESFYSGFKLDLGHTDRFETIGELIDAIYQTIYYYNNQRIHTALKMPPQRFTDQYYLKNNNNNIYKKINKLTRRQLV